MTEALGETRTLPLANGQVATLVRVATTGARRGAILHVHGFADYFLQRHVAEHFAANGWDFYGLDLRGCGRSLREGDLPHYVTDLDQHFEELDLAVAAIRADGPGKLVVLGHSTGGLIAPLWADARRDSAALDLLVLNSPWFDLAESWVHRTIGTALVSALAWFAPRTVVRDGLGPIYGESLHREHHGEWTFELAWKPIEAFPVRAGWFRAIRRGHARLQRGLDVRVPTLVMRSSKSFLHQGAWSAPAQTADTVLDVEHMTRFAPCVGKDVEVVTIDDGMHDLFLSAPPVRAHALAVMDDWLEKRA